MPINFVMQGKCLFSDISRPGGGGGGGKGVRNFLDPRMLANFVLLLELLNTCGLFHVTHQ